MAAVNVRTDYRSDAVTRAGTSNDNYNAPFSPDLLAAVGFPGFGGSGDGVKLALAVAAGFLLVYLFRR